MSNQVLSVDVPVKFKFTIACFPGDKNTVEVDEGISFRDLIENEGLNPEVYTVRHRGVVVEDLDSIPCEGGKVVLIASKGMKGNITSR